MAKSERGRRGGDEGGVHLLSPPSPRRPASNCSNTPRYRIVSCCLNATVVKGINPSVICGLHAPTASALSPAPPARNSLPRRKHPHTPHMSILPIQMIRNNRNLQQVRPNRLTALHQLAAPAPSKESSLTPPPHPPPLHPLRVESAATLRASAVRRSGPRAGRRGTFLRGERLSGACTSRRELRRRRGRFAVGVRWLVELLVTGCEESTR